MPIEFYPLTVAGVLEATLTLSAFVMLLVIGSLVLPGTVRNGAIREDGSRQQYKLNGLLLFALVIGSAIACEWSGVLSLGSIALQLPALAVAANVLALGLSLALFLRSRNRSAPGLGGFFYGADHSPVWLGLDLKMFS